MFQKERKMNMLMLWFWAIGISCSEKTTDSSASAGTDTASDITEGGGCLYEDYPGTCTYEDAELFAYVGTVDGAEVSFAGNPYELGPEDNEPAPGSSVDCTLSYIKSGTCTPCLIDIGQCGAEAFAGMPQ